MKLGVLARAVVMAFTAGLQIVFWVGLTVLLGSYADILILILAVLNICCTVAIIISDNYPEIKIPWIVVLHSLPVAGGIIYLVFGKHRDSRRKKRLRAQIETQQKNWAKAHLRIDENMVSGERNAARQSEYLRNIAFAPAYVNTEVTYFPLGENKFEAMLRELETAEKFIFLEYFIIEQGKMWNAIEEILIRKAQSGVDVRMMYDDLGCLTTLPGNFAKRLHKHGIDCRVFNPMRTLFNSNFNSRDHRKILVIDGNIGFIGGVNLADEYINEKVKYGHWKDTAVMLKGAAVHSLSVMFLSMWGELTQQIEEYSQYAPSQNYESDGVVQPYGDTPLDEDAVGETVYMGMLNSAKDYVYITTPYLIISREMLVSLSTAAKSGIDVRLMLPGIPDKKMVWFLSRSYYKTLLKAGVKIYEYTPGFMHAKMFVSDDENAVVGTINLDYRSLALHYECGVWMHRSSAVLKVKEDYLKTQAKCHEITLENHPYGGRLSLVKLALLGVLRTFSPLF